MCENNNVPDLSFEQTREPIEDALYATKHFLTSQATELAEDILQYIKNAGYKIVRDNNHMQNFFYDEYFNSDIADLLVNIGIDEDDINEAWPDNWQITCEHGAPEPIFQLKNASDIAEYLLDNYLYYKYEDRFPSEQDTAIENKIKQTIVESIDIEKLNKNVPVLYYPTGKTFVITKADVIKFLNLNPPTQ